ncbi:DUF998 domain-containing protein [Nonomuraea jiangxiensis]|uniref:DUF998 domain-containing protein n=1 Tax=Nonomuraea jiangxiensis TaxID=633440 RepID=A0A1G9HFJ6_9ACTN|nr:DUF998 domain-containing protein [Nonomuraea jiangxiensis]SDL11687.1 Protein of unknown function [Nonomuraea jiangxiensis]
MLPRLTSLLALGSIAFSVILTLIDQLGAGAHVDLVNVSVSVSEYAVSERGGVVAAAMALLGIGSLALLAGLRSAGAPVRGLPERLLLVWSGALVVAALIPALPLGGDFEPAAQVHQFVSMAAFVSLPAVGALLVPRLASDARWKPVARAVEWVALAGGFGLLALTYVALPGGGVMIGLVEWLLLGAEVALLVVLAGWLVRLAWLPAGVKSVNLPTYHRFIASRS